VSRVVAEKRPYYRRKQYRYPNRFNRHRGRPTQHSENAKELLIPRIMPNKPPRRQSTTDSVRNWIRTWLGRAPILMEYRLPQDLDLTEKQRAVLENAVREAEKEFKAMHEEMRPRVHAIFLRVENKFLPTLTEKQRLQFEEIRRHETERLKRAE